MTVLIIIAVIECTSYQWVVLAYLACNLLWNCGDSKHPCINKEEKSSPRAKSIRITSQICVRNVSWALATLHLHPPEVQMQILEFQVFTWDLNTLKISSLVPHLRKISVTVVPHVIKKGWYLFQNPLEGSDYWRSRNRRQNKCLITISKEKED